MPLLTHLPWPREYMHIQKKILPDWSLLDCLTPRAHWGLFHYLSASCAAALLQVHCYLGGYASSVLVIQKKPSGLSQLLLEHLCGGGGARLIPAVNGGSGPRSGQGAPWGQVGLLLGAGLGCPPAIPTQAGAWGGGIGHHPAQHALGKLVEKLFQQLVGVCLWRNKKKKKLPFEGYWGRKLTFYNTQSTGNH